MTNAKAYYAVFEEDANGNYVVIFPDLRGCNTFGTTMEEAIEMAEDALTEWLKHSEIEFIKEPSDFLEIARKNCGEVVMAIRAQVESEEYEDIEVTVAKIKYEAYKDMAATLGFCAIITVIAYVVLSGAL